MAASLTTIYRNLIEPKTCALFFPVMPPSRRRHRQPRNLHSSAPSNQPRFMFNVHQLLEITLVSHQSQGNNSIQLYTIQSFLSCWGPPSSHIHLLSIIIGNTRRVFPSPLHLRRQTWRSQSQLGAILEPCMMMIL